MQRHGFDREGKTPSGDVTELEPFAWCLNYLGHASVARQLMRHYLCRGRSGNAGSWSSYLRSWRRRLTPTYFSELGQVLFELLQPKRCDPRSLAKAHALSRELRHHTGITSALKNVDAELDEAQWTHEALRESASHPSPKESGFCRLFWQYQRIHCAMLGHLVLTPGTRGLRWFVRHFDRASRFRPDNNVDLALERTRQDIPGLRAIEMRRPPNGEWRKNRDLALEGLNALKSHKDLEAGFILHFVKSSNDAPYHGKLNFGVSDPGARPEKRNVGLRYGEWVKTQLRAILGLESCLRYKPWTREFLRSVDLAGEELAVPTWAAAIPIRRAQALLDETSPDGRVAPTTIHAGEDYLNLMQGLRNIEDLLQWGLLRPGDRIGHGVALGVCPGSWIERFPCVELPLEEALWNVVWEYDLYRRGFSDALGRGPWLIDQIQTLAGKLWQKKDIDAERVLQLRRLLFCPRVLEYIGYPVIIREEAHRIENPDFRRLIEYLSDPGIRARARIPVSLRTEDHDREFLSNVQSWIRKKVCERNITIESNPTSNGLIVDARSSAELPLFGLVPAIDSASSTHPFPVSINSDDPLTFSTSLAQEYELAYQGLLQQGVNALQAIEWLDRRRRDGMASRFTSEATADPKWRTAVQKSRGTNRR